MEKVKKIIDEFNKERDWDKFHTPENLAKSIAIESGELLECFQWDNNCDIEKVKEELADVMSYAIMLSDKLGLDIEKIIIDKYEKNKEKYPVNKAKGVSTKYTEL